MIAQTSAPAGEALSICAVLRASPHRQDRVYLGNCTSENDFKNRTKRKWHFLKSTENDP